MYKMVANVCAATQGMDTIIEINYVGSVYCIGTDF